MTSATAAAHYNAETFVSVPTDYSPGWLAGWLVGGVGGAKMAKMHNEVEQELKREELILILNHARLRMSCLLFCCCSGSLAAG